MAEIRSLPNDKLSFGQQVSDFYHGRWTGIGPPAVATHKAIGRNLSKCTGNIISAMIDECKDALSREFAMSIEWTEIQAMPKIMGLVARITGRTLVGFPNCRDDVWLRLM